MKAHLSVVSCATVMVLVFATVSACTGPPSSSAPDVSSPAGTATTTGTATGTSKPGESTTGTSTATHTSAATTQGQAATGPATATTTSTPTHTATPTPTTTTPTPTPTTTTPTPEGAPETGGGGTAGLQDGLAIGLGLTAILAGLGGLAYRRRLTRRR